MLILDLFRTYYNFAIGLCLVCIHRHFHVECLQSHTRAHPASKPIWRELEEAERRVVEEEHNLQLAKEEEKNNRSKERTRRKEEKKKQNKRKMEPASAEEESFDSKRRIVTKYVSAQDGENREGEIQASPMQDISGDKPTAATSGAQGDTSEFVESKDDDTNTEQEKMMPSVSSSPHPASLPSLSSMLAIVPVVMFQ